MSTNNLIKKIQNIKSNINSNINFRVNNTSRKIKNWKEQAVKQYKIFSTLVKNYCVWDWLTINNVVQINNKHYATLFFWKWNDVSRVQDGWLDVVLNVCEKSNLEIKLNVKKISTTERKNDIEKEIEDAEYRLNILQKSERKDDMDLAKQHQEEIEELKSELSDLTQDGDDFLALAQLTIQISNQDLHQLKKDLKAILSISKHHRVVIRPLTLGSKLAYIIHRDNIFMEKYAMPLGIEELSLISPNRIRSVAVNDNIVIGYEKDNKSMVTLARGQNRLDAAHCFVVGETGNGKTTLVVKMIKQSVQKNRKVIILDKKGEYKWLANYHHVETVDFGLAESLVNIFDWSKLTKLEQLENMQMLYISLFEYICGANFSEKEKLKVSNALKTAFLLSKENGGNEITLFFEEIKQDGLLDLWKALTNSGLLKKYNSSTKLDLDAEIIIIDTSTIQCEKQAEATLPIILKLLSDLLADASIAVDFVVEECFQYLINPKMANKIEEMLAEYRSKNVGLIFVGTNLGQKADLAARIISNVQYLFIFRLKLTYGITVLENYFETILSLNKRECLVISNNEYPIHTVVTMPLALIEQKDSIVR